ncbi:hypothetical protein P799_24295 [Lysinibacillus sphaericus CBAM5]|uniref:Uncharacterized protein n=1 Tax=Lysinibacillus sphaericus CBAM5 TaxID=1400869 RepID=W7RU55_LYSSH|nr:hypothetical protein P799_24295 [Lysinibacillus sphaericus CBAM5]
MQETTRVPANFEVMFSHKIEYMEISLVRESLSFSKFFGKIRQNK